MDRLVFTSEQSSHLPFPHGCSVWFFPDDTNEQKQHQDRNSYTSIVQGVISTVSLDLRRQIILYQVVKNNNDGTSTILGEEFTENQLAYAFQCPVFVRPKKNEGEHDGGGELYEAVVLQAKNVQGKMIYTIMHNVDGGYIAYKENIEGCRIKYRVVQEEKKALGEEAVKEGEDDTNAANADAQAPPDANAVAVQEQQPPVAEVTVASAAQSDAQSDNHSQVTHESKTAPTASQNSVVDANPKALQGATCGYNNLLPSPATKSTDSLGLKWTDSMASPDDDVEDGEHVAKRAKVDDGSVPKNPCFRITLPLWLQKDKDMKHRLYVHLYGPRDHPHYKQMREKANCNMVVLKNKESHGRMILQVEHMSPTAANKAFAVARRMIEDILLTFQIPGLPPIKDDGSMGRLIYELYSGCSGAHRPRGSQSNAVMQQKNPFDQVRLCCMSLVELPSEGYGKEKRIHGLYLQKDYIFDNIRSLGCTMHLCGDMFNGTPRTRTKYCDPYVLITAATAQDWRGVDRAVQVVKAEIRKHQRNCNCS